VLYCDPEVSGMEDLQVIMVVALTAPKSNALVPEAEARLRCAAEEAVRALGGNGHPRPYLVLCGGYTGSQDLQRSDSEGPSAESELALDFLRTRGLDSLFRQILPEKSSFNTVQNAVYFLRETLRNLPPARVRIIVGISSSYHLRFFDLLRLVTEKAPRPTIYVLTTCAVHWPGKHFQDAIIGHLGELDGLIAARAAEHNAPRWLNIPAEYSRRAAQGRRLAVRMTPFMLGCEFVREILRRCHEAEIDLDLAVTRRLDIPRVLLDEHEQADIVFSGKLDDEKYDDGSFRFLHFQNDKIGVLSNSLFLSVADDALSGVPLLKDALDRKCLVWPENSIFGVLLERIPEVQKSRNLAIVVDSMQIGVEFISSNLVPACMLIPEPWSRVAPAAKFKAVHDLPRHIQQGCFLRRNQERTNEALGDLEQIVNEVHAARDSFSPA
jgi:hypothetical protein